MRSVFEVNNGKIQVRDAADGFQGIAGIACKVATLRRVFGTASSNSLRSSEQNHNCCLHAQSFALRVNLRFASIANYRAFLARDLPLLEIADFFQSCRS